LQSTDQEDWKQHHCECQCCSRESQRVCCLSRAVSPSKSVKTSTAYEYHKLMKEALISRGVPHPPAVNQAFILEQESIDDVMAKASVWSTVSIGSRQYDSHNLDNGDSPPRR
jgi:hypothetical protein